MKHIDREGELPNSRPTAEVVSPARCPTGQNQQQTADGMQPYSIAAPRRAIGADLEKLAHAARLKIAEQPQAYGEARRRQPRTDPVRMQPLHVQAGDESEQTWIDPLGHRRPRREQDQTALWRTSPREPTETETKQAAEHFFPMVYDTGLSRSSGQINVNAELSLIAPKWRRLQASGHIAAAESASQLDPVNAAASQ
jgi:hypothetical protein